MNVLRSHTARLGLLLSLVLGVVAPTPAGEALTLSKSAVLITLTLNAGLARFPCPPGTPPDLCDVNPIPNQHLQLPLPFPQLPSNQSHPDWGGHTRTIVGAAAVICLDAVVNINKPGKAPAHVGGCAVALGPGKPPEGNHIHGFCNLAGGQVNLLFTDALGNRFNLDLHFEIVANVVRLDGHGFKPGSPQVALVTGTGQLFAGLCEQANTLSGPVELSMVAV